jgi:hypothetical protein
MPRPVQLMLCTARPCSFDDPDWIFEPKLDGCASCVASTASA